MELAILLSRDESAIIEHGEKGEPDFDNTVSRLCRQADRIDPEANPRVFGLDEDNELYELAISYRE